MDEIITNSLEEELDKQEPTNTEDPLKAAIEAQMKKIQRQSMLLGAQSILKVILEKIVVVENKPSKTSMNDYKRLIKDLKNFCTTGLSRRVNEDGETELIKEESVVEETVQN